MSSCPQAPWTVSKSEYSLTVGEVFYAENRNFCLPGVPWNMVSTAPKVITRGKDGSHGSGCEGELGR